MPSLATDAGCEHGRGEGSGMARRERRGSRRERARDAERAVRAQPTAGAERWRRPSGRRPQQAPSVAPPPPVRRLLVDVEGASVEVGGIRVEGSPSPEELRGSLVTLGLDDLDDEVRAAHEAFVASVRASRTPSGAALRALAMLRAIARWRLWAVVAGLGGFAAALVVFAAPIWLAGRPDEDLRAELGATALWTGASALGLLLLLLSLTTEQATASPKGAQATAPRRRTGIGAGGVVGMVVLLVWQLLPIMALIVRASLLAGWRPAVVAGLVLHLAAVAAWVVLLVVLRRGPGRPMLAPLGRLLDDLPEARLSALEQTFRARIVALDDGTWTALRSAMQSQADRLLAAGAIEEDTRAAMLRIGPAASRFDAALAARLAHDPAGPIVLRQHVPLRVVAAVVRGHEHGAGLVRRIVAAVAADRRDRGVPFDAAVLVDLVTAARVPVLARDTHAMVALSRLWPAAVIGAWGAAAGSVLATLAWLPSASAFRDPTSPASAVAFAVVAALLAAAVDVRERIGRLRALATTTAWMGVATGATIAAWLVDGASAHSPYLRGLRAGDVLALSLVALVALAAAGWRVAEALRGRRHDAVHANSPEWPLSRVRVAEVEAHRRRRAGAAGAALDDVAAEVEVALRLAVDLGRLEPRVAESTATASRRATWPECDGPLRGSPSR